ncbi:MAG: hypothetical protein ACLFWG_08550 [Longimicrobiales bacterium]
MDPDSVDPDSVDPVSVDVGSIVRRTVASPYSHLITRQTGRAVRLAIEGQVLDAGDRTLSLVDLSEVRVLDFSCADEVVAKLLLRSSDRASGPDTYFVFRGIQEVHREPIDAVLERQSLLAVAETEAGRFELLGTASEEERRVWGVLEAVGRIPENEVERHLPRPPEREILRGLVRRRVALELEEPREYRALSTLIPPPAVPG